MTKKERFDKVINWFKINMPVAQTELEYSNPFELLVAVILSAQCTDKRVNIITPALFQALPNALTMSRASIEQIYQLIKTCSYPNNKAKNILAMSQMLVNQFNGIVPNNIDDLQKLPGVGRKTANVILSVVFNQPALAVDTHVFRVAARLGLSTNAKNPLDTEKQLVKYIPKNLLSIAHHWLILHGRYICLARAPKCQNCGLNNICTYYNKTKKSNKPI